MSGGYVLVEYDKVREYCSEFKQTMDALEVQLVNLAKADWAPKTYGGSKPESGQFGVSPIMPQLFQVGSYDVGTLATPTDWNGWLGSGMTIPGHNTIMQGAATGGVIYEDYKIGIAGIAFLDKVMRVSEVKMQISDKKLPRINIEEGMAYEKMAVIFENGYILDEETGFHLYAYCLTQGPARIKLIGLQLNRVPNKLQTTDTGAVLT